MGLAAATLLAAGAGAWPAAAQTRTGILPPASNVSRPEPRLLNPSAANGDEPGSESAAGADGIGRDGLRGSRADHADATPPDGEEPPADLPPPGLRSAVRDGDLRGLPEPRIIGDGRILVGEPPPTPDGIDPVRVDARSAEDAALFEPDPPSRDPLLFQIEEIEPLKDRRTTRLFRFEPYDPAGIRIGSFVLFPEAELGGGWYSNKLRSPEPRSDAAFEARPSARLVSDWRRHAIELKAAGDLTFHDRFPGEDDRAYALEARGRLDVTRRTNLQALASREAKQESRSGIDANTFGPRADVTTDQLLAALNHRFNRLSVQLRGGVSETTYGATRSPEGGIVSNRERSFTQAEATGRATWEFKPTLSAFTETTLLQRDYAAAPEEDGIRRNSDGERVRVGLAFGENGPYLRGEASIGWGRQRPRDARLESTDAFLLDAALAWRVTALTSLLFNASTDITETTTAFADSVVWRSVEVEARHAFRRNLIASAGLQHARSDYKGILLDESETAARLGIEYHLNREITIFTRYQHLWFDTSERNGDYEADEVKLGVRVRR